MAENQGPRPGYNRRYQEMTPAEREQLQRDIQFRRQADYLARRTGQETYNAFFGGRVSGLALLGIILGILAFCGAIFFGVWYWAIGQYHGF